MSCDVFFWQFLGFLVQTLPVAILCHIPMDSDHLRIGGWRIYGLLSLCLAGTGIVFALILCYMGMSGADKPTLQSYGDIMISLALLAFCLFYWWNYREKTSGKILLLTIMVFYEAIIFTGSSVLMDSGLNRIMIKFYPYNMVNVLVLAGLTAVSMPFMYYFEDKQLRVVLGLLDKKQMWRINGILCAELILYCIFIYCVPDYGALRFQLMIAAYFLSSLLVLYMFFNEIILISQQTQMEEWLKMFDVQYQSFHNNIVEMAHFRHDMRHHFGIISTLNAQGRTEELEKYLNQYVEAYEGHVSSRICDYPLVDTILKYYLEKCHRDEIEVSMDIKLNESMGFDFMDMTVLLGNILENAVLASRELPQKDRRIDIEMMKVKGALLILVKNNCALQRRVNGGNFINTRDLKGDNRKKYMGYGIQSMARIAEKYDGTAEIRQEEHDFSARIVLNIQ